MTLFTTRPGDILKALSKGPLGWHMMVLELGYAFSPDRSTWGWWRRYWNRAQIEETACITRNLEKLLAEMCEVGQIVCLGKSPKDGPWTLPGCCPACKGSGKQAKPAAEGGAS